MFFFSFPSKLPPKKVVTAEQERLSKSSIRDSPHYENWKRWGPFLSERQWATVREDYSPSGNSWEDFPHDHSRSRAYRWGEDGLLGITDRECRLCFSVALWNEKDNILKERLFGLTGPEGNHGEDVKELYYYTNATPTHSYLRGIYKYPISEYPYANLVTTNKSRSRSEPEYEIYDTGVFDNQNYFDTEVEYAKSEPNDIAIRITIHNRSAQEAPVHVLPTGWFRNTWAWGVRHEGNWKKPVVSLDKRFNRVKSVHDSLGTFYLASEILQEDKTDSSMKKKPEWLFTENETNTEVVWKTKSKEKYFKDAYPLISIQIFKKK